MTNPTRYQAVLNRGGAAISVDCDSFEHIVYPGPGNPSVLRLTITRWNGGLSAWLGQAVVVTVFDGGVEVPGYGAVTMLLDSITQDTSVGRLAKQVLELKALGGPFAQQILPDWSHQILPDWRRTQEVARTYDSPMPAAYVSPNRDWMLLDDLEVPPDPRRHAFKDGLWMDGEETCNRTDKHGRRCMRDRAAHVKPMPRRPKFKSVAEADAWMSKYEESAAGALDADRKRRTDQ